MCSDRVSVIVGGGVMVRVAVMVRSDDAVEVTVMIAVRVIDTEGLSEIACVNVGMRVWVDVSEVVSVLVWDAEANIVGDCVPVGESETVSEAETVFVRSSVELRVGVGRTVTVWDRRCVWVSVADLVLDAADETLRDGVSVRERDCDLSAVALPLNDLVRDFVATSVFVWVKRSVVVVVLLFGSE